MCGSRGGGDGTAWAVGPCSHGKGGHPAWAPSGAGRSGTHSPCADAPLPSPAGFICIRSRWVCSSHCLATWQGRRSRRGSREPQGTELGFGCARSQQCQNPVPVPFHSPWCGMMMELSSVGVSGRVYPCVYFGLYGMGGLCSAVVCGHCWKQFGIS